MAWTFTLPLALASANEHVVNGRHAATAARYRRERDAWAHALRFSAIAAGVPLVGVDSPRLRAVWIIRLWGKRQRAWDDDNLIAACKGLRDAMQTSRLSVRRGVARRVPGASIVVNDGPRWSTWSYGQERSADGRPGVRVRIEDIETRSEP